MRMDKKRLMPVGCGALVIGLAYVIAYRGLVPALNGVLTGGAQVGRLLLFLAGILVFFVIGVAAMSAALRRFFFNIPIDGVRGVLRECKTALVYLASILMLSLIIAVLNGFIALAVSRGAGTGEWAKLWVDIIAGILHFLLLPVLLLLHPAVAENPARPIRAFAQAWRRFIKRPQQSVLLAAAACALGLAARLVLPTNLSGAAVAWEIIGVIVLSAAAGAVWTFAWDIYLAPGGRSEQ